MELQLVFSDPKHADTIKAIITLLADKTIKEASDILSDVGQNVKVLAIISPLG